MSDSTVEPSPSGPLQGLRVIELGSTVAGPFCARLFADFGADVIKVEQAEGDAVRSMGRQQEGRSLYAASILSGKRPVSIDLRSEAGRDLVRRLCEGAFSFMEPHVPAFDRLGAIAARADSRLPGNAPNSLYETRDGRHIVIAAAADAVFRRLADAMGRPELATDPRFADARARARNADACEELVVGRVARTTSMQRSRRSRRTGCRPPRSTMWPTSSPTPTTGRGRCWWRPPIPNGGR